MKRFTIALQIAFFVLTILAVAALFFYCGDIGAPKGWIVLGVSLVTAEILIRRGFWRTGIEAGLWAGGLCGFIFSLPSTGKPEAMLAFVAAFAIVAARLRHAFFGAVAVALTLVYLGLKHLDFEALFCGLGISVIASLFARRSFFAFTAVAAPVVGYFVYRGNQPGTIGMAILLLATAAINMAIGIRMLERAPLLAAALCIGLGCYEGRNLIATTLEVKLIVAGAALLGVSFALMRILRDRKTGVVVTPTKPHELQDAMQIGAMLPMATPDAGPARPQPVGGGGEFGGAGASGQY